MSDPTFHRYRSRTFWIVMFVIAIATALVWFGRIEGAGWITVVLGMVSAWQLRRAHDNRLDSENGK